MRSRSLILLLLVLLAAANGFAQPSKIHRSARREAARGRAWLELNVFFRDGVTLDAAEATLEKAGGVVQKRAHFALTRSLSAFVPARAIDALANDEQIVTILGPFTLKPKADNANSAALSHVTELYGAPYGLTGQNVVLSLFELAEGQSSHPDFGGRLTVHTSGGTTSDMSHATHVAGTIGGSGSGNASAKGMAPAATIHQFNVYDNGEDWLGSKATNLAPLGVVADNNSWGYELGWISSGGWLVWLGNDEYFGAYDLLTAAPIDKITRDTGILFVHSAGNDASQAQPFPPAPHRHVDDNGDIITDRTWCYSANGSGTDCPTNQCTAGPEYCEVVRHLANLPWTTVGVTASAKNVLTVGAVDSYGTILGFSSRGPARDGRVKPELVARGSNVYSTVPTSTYGLKSGTSMAAPVVTGIAGLMTQLWRQTFNGATPDAAMLKTLLVAGAGDRGNPGPDYTYGFGLVNAKASADLVLARQVRSGSATQQSESEYAVTIGEGQTLRVILGWSDPEIVFSGDADIAAKALVNDLDVRVIAPNGVTYLPYVLDKNNPSASATTGVNTVDNTEMLEIVNVATGTYRVIVRGTSVPQGPQPFALVANAPVTAPLTLTATGTATPSVSLSWNAIDGATSYEIVRNGTTIANGVNALAYTDNAVTAGSAYVYRVVAHLPAFDVSSNADLAVAGASDLAISGVIRLQHVTELESRINTVRALAGLGAMSWSTTPALHGPMRALHVGDLRFALNAARVALGLTPLSGNGPQPGAIVRAADLIAIRDALR